jgi:SAM-dependent methyltransferase
MDTPSSEELLRVRADDPAYRAGAEAEARYWHNVHPLGLEAMEQQVEPGPVETYHNERFTGDPALPWQDAIATYGEFRRGIVLGTSAMQPEARLLETNPSLHVTFVDISAGALERRRDDLGARFPGRVDTQVADLNFLELPEETYDLIVSASTVHHVTNLEHLAFQVNRALTSDGYFFLQDYVGECRFQFRDEKKRVFEVIFDRSRARAGLAPGVFWPDASNLSPFCGVRSEETLSVFREHLREQSVRTASALTVPLMRSRPLQSARALAPRPRANIAVRAARRLRKTVRPDPPPRFNPIAIDPQLLSELNLVGDVLTEAGILLPGNAFAIYRKRV